MKIHSNYNLIHANTFGVEAFADTFVHLENEADAIDFVQHHLDKNKPYMLIGEGSNILFTKDYQGTLMQMQNKGFELVDENPNFVWIRAAAGEIWDDFVAWSVQRKYAGAENLSKIPGTIGAAPIQNIGAYGVEFESIFNTVEAIEIASGKKQRFYLKELNFGYRDSIFKTKLKNKFIISSVILKLNKFPLFKTDYGNIQEELNKMNYENLNVALVREAISTIRASKLPDPKEFGNAGSFFKNPIVVQEKYASLKLSYPNLIAYELSNGNYKLAAGWLIDRAGLKGFTKGKVAVHKNQALIIVNLGGAKGSEILAFSEEIQQKVFDLFGVELEREVNLI
ncbi:MAG: UDP-N-acetylmuramate dehydrogenase [Bacteroidales bacterium]|nr:UDP-N-acetylmuramate dehydrogenase [Bacteroidales bacterium]